MGSLVNVGEHRLWVEGARASEAGDPIVLLHPSVTDLTIWDHLVEDLPGPVLRFDRPGYGKSPAPEVATRPVDDLLGLLDTLEIRRAHLVGNSMGGATAMAAAMLAPGRVASLTLLASAVPDMPWSDDMLTPEEAAHDLEYQRLAEAGDIEGMTELNLRAFAGMGSDAYLRSQVRAALEFKQSDQNTAEPDPSIWEWIPQVAAPLTIVLGEHDEHATNLAGRALADHVPHAKVVTLVADHFPQYRDPAGTAGAILRTIGRAT